MQSSRRNRKRACPLEPAATKDDERAPLLHQQWVRELCETGTPPSEQAGTVILTYQFFAIQISSFPPIKNSPKTNCNYIASSSADPYAQLRTDETLTLQRGNLF